MPLANHVCRISCILELLGESDVFYREAVGLSGADYGVLEPSVDLIPMVDTNISKISFKFEYSSLRIMFVLRLSCTSTALPIKNYLYQSYLGIYMSWVESESHTHVIYNSWYIVEFHGILFD